MFLYIDSLFVEGRDREVRPLYEIPESVTKLYLMAMREHDRPAVLISRSGAGWDKTPDWRFDRQVIRLALQLQQEARVGRGDRVAVLCELRRELLVVDFAAIGIGATAAFIPPSLDQNELTAIVAEVQPKVVFTSGKHLERLMALRNGTASLDRIVCFDGLTAEADGYETFASVVDLGGTLDTPERAQNFRYYAREMDLDMPIIQHHVRPYDCQTLDHAQAMAGIKDRLMEDPARSGDLAYVAAGDLTLSLRLALFAFVGDGRTTIALGTPGRELDEIAELKPAKIVASPDLLERAIARARATTDGNSKLIQIANRLSAKRRARQESDAIRAALGGAARWIAPTAPLDEQVSGSLSAVAAVGADTT